MYRECLGGPFDGEKVPDYGPGYIDLLKMAEMSVALYFDVTPITLATMVPPTVRYWGCGNGHYHHDPE